MSAGRSGVRRRRAWLAAAVTAVAAAFFWPRVIVAWLGDSSPWASYLYQYGMGLIVFLFGVGVILDSGACRPGRGRDGFWLAVLFAGFAFFAVLHLVWILAALGLPYRGGGP